VGRPSKARAKLPPYVHAVKAKGKQYYYYQPHRGSEREKERVKLPGEPFDQDGLPDADWWNAYRVCAGEKKTGPQSGTFSALISAYKESPEWKELSPRTQVLWEPLLGKIKQAWATLSVRGLEARHVLRFETPMLIGLVWRTILSGPCLRCWAGRYLGAGGIRTRVWV
jgi:hypothetical protein